MNSIEFKIVTNNGTHWRDEYDTTRILIDGVDLIDRLKKFEKPFAKQENNENLAGSYEGLPPERLYENLTGEPGYTTHQTAVLECSCGCEGCWDFLAEIRETESEIVWTNFENNHRGRESHHFWDYSAFRDLVFDKSGYRQAIEGLKAAIGKKEA